VLIRERKGMHTKSPSAAAAAERTIPKTGAQIIVDALLAHGLDTVFGYTGAAVLPLFDRLYEAPIRFFVPVHEQGGCHMADAYARASGKTGVIIATSGPGACNLVTGLATAMMDSIPLVAITGQDRRGRVSGGPHHRDHAGGDQA
jgi:acetolactate synthase-1/2/3 large subunit